MKFTKAQLNHIEKILNPDEQHSIPHDEKDLQLDVSFHKIDDIEMAKIHIATKEEVVYSKWENFLSTVEEKAQEKEKKNYLAFNTGIFLTALFFIPLCIMLYVFKDQLTEDKRTILYVLLAIVPLIWYFTISKLQKVINNRFYKNIRNELKEEFKIDI